MLRYETLVLTTPEITQDETKHLESEIGRIAKTNKASIISFDKWGKCRLAYPVKKNDYGVYFLARFELDGDPNPMLDELKTLFAVKLNEMIMRSMTSSLDPEQGLEYERPLSVEEAPARESASFGRQARSEASQAPQDLDQETLMDEEEA